MNLTASVGSPISLMLANFNLLPGSHMIQNCVHSGSRISYRFITALPGGLIIAHAHVLYHDSFSASQGWGALSSRKENGHSVPSKFTEHHEIAGANSLLGGWEAQPIIHGLLDVHATNRTASLVPVLTLTIGSWFSRTLQPWRRRHSCPSIHISR